MELISGGKWNLRRVSATSRRCYREWESNYSSLRFLLTR